MLQLKYTGAFKDLIPLGFHFQKMYADNQRCYTNFSVEGPNRVTFWIWQSGRDIELEDWYGLSAYVIKYMQEHPFTPYPSGFKRIGMVNWIELLCNRQTYEIREKTFEDDPVNKFEEVVQGKITRDEFKAFLLKRNEEVREISFVPAKLSAELEILKGRYEIIDTKE